MRSDTEVVAALRLAMVAARDARAFQVVATELLKSAPPSDGLSGESVQLLLDAIDAVDAELAVA